MSWLLAGLGNPGFAYRHTRHNVGFHTVDRLAAGDPAARWRAAGGAERSRLQMGGHAVHLIKPLTYMNRSGDAVAPALAASGLRPDQLVVVHDDVDLPLGRIRVKAGGGHGGHRGLRSIVARLGSREFRRVRLGVGRPPAGQDVIQWVLGDFGAEEQATLDDALDRACAAIALGVTAGWEAAANRFNAAPRAGGGG
jgi:PTH1 family peptidyl-tRNA hydrolase